MPKPYKEYFGDSDLTGEITELFPEPFWGQGVIVLGNCTEKEHFL